MLADLGFQGLEAEKISILLPHKKPKNGELNDLQKEQNRWHSGKRVRIEHKIAHMKSARIIKDIYRSRLWDREDQVMRIACALENLRNAVRIGDL